MKSIQPAKLSFILTLLTILSLIISAGLLIFIRINFGGEDVLLALSILPIWHLINYFIISKVLQNKERKWAISLIKADEYKVFKGGTFLRFYMGFFWRVMVLGFLINPIVNAFEMNGLEAFLFSLTMTSFMIYIAYIWLIKHPFGETRISFNIAHKIDRIIDEEEVLPTVIEAQRRSSEGFLSVLKDFIAGTGYAAYFVSYLIMGIVQFAAIFDFFRESWGWWYIPSLLASGVLAYVPVLGSIAGVYSAYNVWEWSLFWSLLLFLWPLALFAFVFIFIYVADLFNRMKRVY